MTSIFAAEKARLFRQYTATIRFRDRVIGATPSNPKLIEAWIRTKAGLTREDEIRHLTAQTLIEIGLVSEDMVDDPSATFDSITQAAEAVAKKTQMTVFKRDAAGLYLESRIVKAMLRECVNSAFPWGSAHKFPSVQTKKSAKSFFAERVFINPEHIALGVTEPTGIDQFVGHVSGPQGPRSTLSYHEYVERATATFDVVVFRDEIHDDQWATIWVLAEEIGLGAMRSQGFGRFDVLAWAPTEPTNGRVDALLAQAIG